MKGAKGSAPDFRLLMDGLELGTCFDLAIDEGMGVAFGGFLPADGYQEVRSLFRNLSEALHTRSDEVPRLCKLRDDLSIQLTAADGTTIRTSLIMIWDFDVPDTWEIEVSFADPEATQTLVSMLSGGCGTD